MHVVYSELALLEFLLFLVQEQLVFEDKRLLELLSHRFVFTLGLLLLVGGHHATFLLVVQRSLQHLCLLAFLLLGAFLLFEGRLPPLFHFETPEPDLVDTLFRAQPCDFLLELSVLHYGVDCGIARFAILSIECKFTILITPYSRAGPPSPASSRTPPAVSRFPSSGRPSLPAGSPLPPESVLASSPGLLGPPRFVCSRRSVRLDRFPFSASAAANRCSAGAFCGSGSPLPSRPRARC